MSIDIGSFFITLIMTIVVLLISMTIHEFAHNAVAHWWGDPTPANRGKLTLNPLAHITPAGWVLHIAIFAIIGGRLPSALTTVLIVGIFVLMFAAQGNLSFMALGQAAIQPRLMRDPRWGMFWTTAAGPLSNLVLAFVCAMIMRLTGDVFSYYPIAFPQYIKAPIDLLGLFLWYSVFYNVFLGVFNLLPFAPLDGWHMMLSLLPGSFLHYKDIPAFIRENLRPLADFLSQPAYKWQQWQQLSQMIFMVLILIGFVMPGASIIGMLISQPTSSLIRLFTGV